MDFKKLEAQFKTFIETELKSNKSDKKNVLDKEDTSIFSNHKYVNNFFEKQYGLDTDETALNLKTLLNMEIKDSQFVDNGEFDFVDDIELEDSEEAVSDLQKNIGSSMIEVVNDMLADKDMQKVIDKNGDGELSAKEIKTFLKSAAEIDGNEDDLTLEDILSAVDAVKNLEEVEEEVDIDEDIDEDIDAPEAADNTAPAQSTGGGGSVGGYSGGGSVGGASAPVSNSANPAAAKTIDNMNADELKKELETKKSDLSDKQAELDKAASGETPELKALQEKIDDAYDKYQEELKKVDEELAKELDDKKNEIDDKKQEISDKEAEITENEGKVSDAETAVKNAESKISSLESAISSITSSLSGDLSDEQKASLNTKKSELQAQLSDAKSEKTKAEDNLKKAKEALETSKEEKETLEGELETLEGEMEEIEAKILEAAPEMEKYMTEYKDAQKEFDTQKADAISKAQEAVKVAQAEVDKVQTKLTEVENKAIEAAAKLSSLAGTYNFKGENYNCLMDQAEFDALVQDALNGGAGTKFGKNDKCLSIAETFGARMTGDSNTSWANSGGYMDATKYSVFNSEDKDAVLAKVKEELDAGRPPVLHVNGAGSGRHYVTVVGYKQSAGDSLKEEDLLIWDSYDSSVRSLPDGRHMITGWSTGRQGSDGYGWQVYVRK